ncbi:MAG: ABC transporter substrate-binding protein, partial [gamma proteobacterium symbiont of Bathyaustriella thionipta]|nr:ABC transporter substrate-binding protein [gamma proteobacterium symbiont of Bathyaustriella thionipta]
GQKCRQLTEFDGGRGHSPSKIASFLPDTMYKSANGWKVFDVLANGRSALVHYRQQYQRMLRPQIPQNRIPVFHPQPR